MIVGVSAAIMQTSDVNLHNLDSYLFIRQTLGP